MTTTYNADNQAVSVKVETPSSETSDTPVVAESNLTTNEVTVNGQSVVAADLSAPVETVSLTATQAPAKRRINTSCFRSNRGYRISIRCSSLRRY